MGPRFEDDRNRVRLGDAVVLDLTVSMQLARRAQLFLSFESTLGSELELARMSDGVATLGSPTLVRGGLRVGF